MTSNAQPQVMTTREAVLKFAPAMVGRCHQQVNVAIFTPGAGKCFQQQLRQPVDQNGDAQQDQTHFKKRAAVGVAGRLGKFIGHDAGQGVTRRKKVRCDLDGVADDHGHRHCFAQRPAQAEDDGAETGPVSA